MDRIFINNNSDILKDKELEKLYNDLINLKEKLDLLTLDKFNRINPFVENLFDWKQKGEKLFPGKNITIYDTCSIVGDVEIGENTWIGPYTAIDGGGGVKIGSNCSISTNVNIVSHDTVKWALSGGKHPYEYAPIAIGDNCFIGTGAFIGKGVKIGSHCLIGAGAVVTEDIPDNSIALGVPAKVKGEVLFENGKIEFKYK